MKTSTPTRRLERETCSRCCGTGHYSYCQMYGTLCFQCGGKKQVLTKRGAAANQYLVDLRSVPARDLVVGQKIRADVFPRGMTAGTIVSIEREIQEGASQVNGVMVPYAAAQLHIVTDKYDVRVSPSSRVLLCLPATNQAASLALALDYQDMLTKAGTPRKR